MKFIVTLVSIQHPVLITKDAVLNARHLPFPLSHPPINPQFVLSFQESLMVWLPPSLTYFFPFPSPMVFC